MRQGCAEVETKMVSNRDLAIALITLGLMACEAAAQIKPKIDEGTVKENTVRTSLPTVSPVRSRASKPTNAFLTVVTDNPNADVIVNGVNKGRVQHQQLSIEL